jgi:small subunit ribosomal protein S4
MGDPKKQRRKYEGPKHPWKSERIEAENELQKKYGLKSKREIWRANSAVRKFRSQARVLLGSPGPQSEKKAKELLDKLNKMGLINSQNMEDVLSLTVENLLDRRLQTVVFQRGLAKTPNQARQMITHKHVLIGKRIVNIPRYSVSPAEEGQIKLNIEIKEPEPVRKKPKKEAGEKPAEEAASEKPKEEVVDDVKE